MRAAAEIEREQAEAYRLNDEAWAIELHAERMELARQAQREAGITVPTQAAR